MWWLEKAVSRGYMQKVEQLWEMLKSKEGRSQRTTIIATIIANIQLYDQRFPIHVASVHPTENAHVFVNVLIEMGADVNVKDSYGQTALMCAIQALNNNVVKLLLKHPDIQLDLTDQMGRTALHWVVQKMKSHPRIRLEKCVFDSLLCSGTYVSQR